MSATLRLLCVLAHPDDESLGIGATLARYVAEGVEISLLTATRGERGWFGPAEAYPGPEKLGEIREEELCTAINILGLKEVTFLDYRDGELDRAEPAVVINQITAYLRRVRPHVVITFGPEGSYGHPDHIAISQFTMAATICAPDPTYETAVGRPHRVAKLYYMVATAEEYAAYQLAFGDLVMTVDGVERHATPWPLWAATTHIDTGAFWQQAWEAIACHRSQLPNFQALQALPEEEREKLWRIQHFYRVFSLVNGGREPEDDLFAGLR